MLLVSAQHEAERGLEAEAGPVAALKGLSVAFGHRVALIDVSLEVGPRDIVMLIGPNGSGKSTLLRAVAGYLGAARGRVLFRGRDITHLRPHERARLGVGYLMQGGRIFPSLTVEENIEMAAASRPKAGRAENVETVLGLFPHLIGQSRVRGGLLSGGDRQALALALILVRRPRLLLLDEPTAGLAPALVEPLMEGLSTLCRQWELSVIMAEQNIAETVGIASRVVALVNGRQISLADDTPRTLMSERRLEEVFYGPLFKRGEPAP